MYQSAPLPSIPIVVLSTVLITGMGPQLRGAEQKTSYVTVETPADDEPMLVIKYPWKVHRNPSVELRALVEGEEDSARVRPLHFRHDIMADEITVAVFETQDAASSTRTVAEFTDREIDFLAIGKRNLFNRPAVTVTCQTEVLKPNREPFKERARRAIYPFLEPWAADDRTLFLSPPKPTFVQPATIRVFFLRDSQVVWSERLKWPGLEDSTAPAPPSGQAPATQ